MTVEVAAVHTGTAEAFPRFFFRRETVPNEPTELLY